MVQSAKQVITLALLMLVLLLGAGISGHLIAQENSEPRNVMYAAIDQGTDDLYYMRCLVGCEYFYELAAINDLYQPFPNTWEAYNYFLAVRAAYEGRTYVPLPPPQSG